MPSNEAVPDRIVVRVFGTPEIRIGASTIGLGSGALFALALYLTTRAGERVTKAELLEVFWPEGSLDDRRHAMRQMMYRLRKAGLTVGERGGCFTIDPSTVDSDLRLGLDLHHTELASLADIERLSASLPEFSSRLPRAFLEWIEEIRSRLGSQVAKAAARLLHQSRRRGAWAETDRCVQILLRHDPLNEEATLAAAESAAVSGMKSRALEILDVYIDEVTSINPAAAKPATQLRKRIAERRSKWADATTREVALVGRIDAMAAINEALEATATSRGHTVLILGASGFGKSRILSEAHELSIIRGARTVAIRVEPTEALNPIATARELARRLLEQPGAAAVEPSTMRIARALTRDQPDDASSLSVSAPTPVGEVSRCLAALVGAVSHESRLTILIDDLQNADDLSLEVLAAIVASTRGGRCTMILAGLSGVTQKLSAPLENGWARVVRLSPLSREETEALAQATAIAYNRRLSEQELRTISDNAAGHPLFARELALSLSKSSNTTSLPESLADVVSRNLAAQDPSALSVLRVVALLGDMANASRVRRASIVEPASLLRSIERLAQDGILHTSQSQSLRLHDSWRAAVLDGMPGPTRALLALECADLLRQEDRARDYQLQRRVAELLTIAGEQDSAMNYTIASIDSLLNTGLHMPAIEAAAEALSQSRGPQTSARLRLRQAVGQLGLGYPRLALELAESVWRSSLLQADDLLPEHLLALCVAADCAVKTDSADTGPHGELLALAKSDRLSKPDRARACLWGVRLGANSSGVQSLHLYKDVLSTIEQGQESSAVVALAKLILASETGTPADIVTASQRLSLVDQKSMSLSDTCMLLRCQSQALRMAHELDGSAAAGESAYKLAEQGGLTYSARVTAEQLCHMHIDFGQLADATLWLAEATRHANAGSQGVTTTSHEHTIDRLALALGDHKAAAARILHRLDKIHNLGNAQSRSAETALAAAVLACSGDRELAAFLLSTALASAPQFAGRFSGDFLADTLLFAASKCGQVDAAREFGLQHLQARRASGRCEVPPGLSHLLALSAES